MRGSIRGVRRGVHSDEYWTLARFVDSHVIAESHRNLNAPFLLIPRAFRGPCQGRAAFSGRSMGVPINQSCSPDEITDGRQPPRGAPICTSWRSKGQAEFPRSFGRRGIQIHRSWDPDNSSSYKVLWNGQEGPSRLSWPVRTSSDLSPGASLALKGEVLIHGPSMVARPVGSEWRTRHSLQMKIQENQLRGDQK